jgi:hypothetical protein
MYLEIWQLNPKNHLFFEKMDLICQVLISKNKIPDFYKRLQQLAKLQKGFLISYNNCDM